MPEQASTQWQPSSGWSIARGRQANPFGEAGIELHPLDGVPMATIIAPADAEPELNRLLQARLGCAVPNQGQANFGGAGDLVWSAPGQWLAVGRFGHSLADLPAVLADVAAVTDQGDGRALVRISGASARHALSKGVALDLHATAFARGSTAVTSIAHIAVQIWQVDDAPAYLIAAPRSFADSFWSWLTSACAEFGYVVTSEGEGGQWVSESRA